MPTFHGDPDLKRKIMERAERVGKRVRDGDDRNALYWSMSEWCPAEHQCLKPGCDHGFYAAELGVPIIFAYAERAIFCGLEQSCAARWPQRMVRALPVGMDEQAIEAGVKRMAREIVHEHLLPVAFSHEQENVIIRLLDLYDGAVKAGDLWDALSKDAEAAGSDRASIPQTLIEHRQNAGAQAALAVSYFARSNRDPRFIADAIERLPYLARSNYLAKHLAVQNVRHQEEWYGNREENMARLVSDTRCRSIANRLVAEVRPPRGFFNLGGLLRPGDDEF